MSQEPLSQDPLRLDIRDGVAHLVIHREQRLNAIDCDTMGAFEAHLDTIEGDESVVALVISSVGSRAFVAGGDLKEFGALQEEADAARMSRRMGEVLTRLERLEALVVAAVDGFAFGGGCELLLACDLVISAPHSKLGMAQVRFALTPGWGGGVRLVRRVGRARALRLLLSGVTLTAKEALAYGLIDEIDSDPLAAAAHLASTVPQGRALVGAIKAVVTPGPEALDAAIERERAIFVERWMSGAHFEAVERFFAKKS